MHDIVRTDWDVQRIRIRNGHDLQRRYGMVLADAFIYGRAYLHAKETAHTIIKRFWYCSCDVTREKDDNHG